MRWHETKKDYCCDALTRMCARLRCSMASLSKCWRAVSILVAIAILAFLVFQLWDWLRWEGTESRSDTLRNLILILGAPLGIALAVWRSMVAQKQVNIAQKNLENERIRQGIDMLGSTHLVTRIGGIYTLEHRAKEYSKEYHIQIMDLLCIFVRYSTTKISTTEETGSPDPDVQAALIVFGRRNQQQCNLEITEGWRLDLSKSHIEGAELQGINLENANLWNIHLERANLRGARLGGGDLREAHLEHANLQEAHLEGVDLEEACLENANLIGANLKDADLKRADLKLTKLQNANLKNAKLQYAYLENARLENVNLENAKLRMAKLEAAQLRGANLVNANLQSANLRRTNLFEANLENTNLQGTDLERAHMYKINLNGANLQNTNLTSVRGITQTVLNQAACLVDEDGRPLPGPDLTNAFCAESKEPLVWLYPSDPSPTRR